MRSFARPLALASLVAACGGSNAKPPAEPPPPPAATAPELDAAAPPPVDEPDAAAAPASAPAAAAPAPPSEPEDACTPVAVDFEKRARPDLKACYREGKKKDPDLKGTVRLAVDIDTLGKVRGIKITEKTLPEPVAKCMLGVLKKTPLPEAKKCPGKTITIPVTFPTPH